MGKLEPESQEIGKKNGRCTILATIDNGAMSDVLQAVSILEKADRILVFSGAGISTESGIPDFRGPEGLWTKLDPDDFHIDRYRSDREIRVRSWAAHANGERWGEASPQPNRGHRAIVELAVAGRLAGVVTQNIDGLQQEAGLAPELIAELHGNMATSACVSCGSTWHTEEILNRVRAGEPDPSCRECGSIIKTNVVMFGEELPIDEMEKAFSYLALADALVVVGSTVAVWPASDVVLRAAFKPIPVVIINQGETEADHLAAARVDGPIGEVLPEIVRSVLAGRS